MLGQTVDKLPTYAAMLGLIYTAIYGAAYSAMGSGLSALTKRASLLKTPAPSVEPLREYPGVPPAVQSILTPEDRAASGIDLQTGNVFLQSTPLSVAASSASSTSSGTTSLSTVVSMPGSIRDIYLTILMAGVKLHELLLDEREALHESIPSQSIDSILLRYQQLSQELATIEAHLPFSIPSIVPNLVAPRNDLTSASFTVISLMIQFHHVRISLHSSQLFRLFEFGLHDALLNDANFSKAVESAMTIFEGTRLVNGTFFELTSGSPAFCRGCISAMRILKIAQTIGFMGIDANILEQVYLVFKQSLEFVGKLWIWGQFTIDTLTAEYTGRVPITTETRIML
eukprot:jgi/Hompol1/3565/HPOL_006620-RA